MQSKFLIPIIIAAVVILGGIVSFLILNANREDVSPTSSSEQTTKQATSEFHKPESAEIALVAIEKKALKEKEEEIKKNLMAIEKRLKDQQKLLTELTQQQTKLEKTNEEIRAERQNIRAERKQLQREWQKLEKVKKEKEQAKQQEAMQEKPEENKIIKEKQLREMAKGFETMRSRDAANILIKMLEKNKEDVLDLLNTMDDRTRTRIISSISRERVDTAATLTKELMEIQ